MKLLDAAVPSKTKYLLAAILICLILAAKPVFAGEAEGTVKQKVFVYIIDQIGIEDIARGNAPNLKHLIKNGGVGLMNVRGKAFSWENRESGYLSLNMGRRAGYPQDSDRAGDFGRTARENGIRIAVIDHTDAGSPGRNSLLLAADEHGKIPLTATASNNKTLINQFKKYYQKADIIIVDFGLATDTLPEADDFLGQAVSVIDPANTLVLVVTPNPSRKMIEQGNFSLTFAAAAGPGIVTGVLTSNTTKRPGLISNEDFAPTVFGFLGINKDPVYIGEPVKVKKQSDSLITILNNLSEYKNLKISRYIIHGFYVTGVVLTLLGIYISVLRRRSFGPLGLLRVFTCSVISLPMTVFVLSPLLAFNKTYLYALVIVLAAGVVGYLISRTGGFLRALGAISFITSLSLLFGLLSGGSHYLASPLGFDDVFMGGRYYGINNDTMGILLGSTLLGLFVTLESFPMPRIIAVSAGFIYTVLTAISMTPAFGANVGGTIAAMVVTTVTVVVLVSKKQVNWRYVVLIVIAVFAVEVGIAYLDATLNPEKTHAGKVLAELLAGSFWSKFIHILWSKLSLFLLMLVVPPWNLVLLAEFYLIYRLFRLGEFSRLYRERPYLDKGFAVLFFGGVVAFLFNDTGVIATAMMFTYLVLPMGLLIKNR